MSAQTRQGTSETRGREASERPLSLRLVVRIFATLGPYLWLVLLGNVLVGICVAADMRLIYEATRLIEAGVPAATAAWRAVGILAALALINRVFGYGQFMVTLYASNKAVERLRQNLFAKLQALPKSFYDQHKTGWLIARGTGDIWHIAEFMTYTLMMIVVFLVAFGYAAFRIWRISPILLAPSLLLAPAITVLTFWYRRRMSREQRFGREQNSRLVAHMSEHVRGVRVVQAFAREPRALGEFNALNTVNRDNEIRIARLDALFMPSVNFLGILNTALVVAFAAWLPHSPWGERMADTLTVGNVAAYIMYANVILWPMRFVVELYSMSLRAMAAAERIFEILDMPVELADPDRPAPVDAMRGEIEFRHADFRYGPDSAWIFRDFNLHVPAGQTLALVGETGAGKTTLSALAARFYDVTGGEVLLDGRNIREYGLEALHRRMAIVPQDGFLFSGTVLDNIRFRRPDMTREETIALARDLGIHDAIASLAQGYDTVVLEGGASVSEGQRQLISIARALAADPAVLILDEPTSALDVHTESLLQTALLRLMRGRTTLLIAHRLSTVRHADRIVVLEHGRLAEAGAHEELVRRNGLYAALVRQSLQ